MFVFNTHLINKDADKVRVDHRIDDVDAEHHDYLIGASCIYFDQGEGDRRIVPCCEPLVKQ